MIKNLYVRSKQVLNLSRYCVSVYFGRIMLISHSISVFAIWGQPRTIKTKDRRYGYAWRLTLFISVLSWIMPDHLIRRLRYAIFIQIIRIMIENLIKKHDTYTRYRYKGGHTFKMCPHLYLYVVPYHMFYQVLYNVSLE